MQHFAAQALRLESENGEIIYWRIYALVKVGTRQSAEKEYNRAKEVLSELQMKELN